MNIDQIYVAGLPNLDAAASALRVQTGAEVQALAGSAQLGGVRDSVPKWQVAGVVGALA